MGATQSVGAPLEKVLNDALKPYSLQDVAKHQATLHRLIKTFISREQIHTSKVIPDLTEIIKFLGKLAQFSSKEQRAEWFSSTYNRDPPKKPPAEARTISSGSHSTVVIDSIKDEMGRLQKVVNEKEVENHKLARSLSTGEEERERLRLESEDLKLRLAKEMSDKVSADESNLENVNIKNRPMKVAEDYQQFRTTSWFSAKEQLNKANIPELEALRTLAELLKTAETCAQIKQQEVTHSIYSVFSQQASHGAQLLGPLMPQSKMATVEVKKIPGGLKNAIGDFLRTTADTADISAIVEEIHKEAVPNADKKMRTTMSRVKNSDKLCVKFLRLEDYMNDCARLAWKMVVQRPPMTLDSQTGINEAWEGDKYQDVFFASKDPKQPGNVVLFYVYPRLKHKDATMVKGSVFIGSKGDSKQ